MGKFELPTTPQRSKIMAAIRGKGNLSTERRLVSILRQYHLTGWSRHANLLGHPDFVFRKQKWRFLWMVVSGMAALNAPTSYFRIVHTGSKRSPGTLSRIGALLASLGLMGGVFCVSGNIH